MVIFLLIYFYVSLLCGKKKTMDVLLAYTAPRYFCACTVVQSVVVVSNSEVLLVFGHRQWMLKED